jgi:hypothetical protein
MGKSKNQDKTKVIRVSATKGQHPSDNAKLVRVTKRGWLVRVPKSR